MFRCIVFVILLLIGAHFSYASPTVEEIKEAAKVLEIPYDELNRFVQLYHQATSTEVPKVDARQLVSEYLQNEFSADAK